MKKRPTDSGWNVEGALGLLRATIDPYLWEQGQELYRRGAVEDVQMAADGTIQVQVLDPRDARRFFVTVEKDSSGRVVARCKCPYRLGGACRHQVVSLEYLRAVSQGTATSPGSPQASPAQPAVERGAAVASPTVPEVTPTGPALYRLFAEDGKLGGVSTRPDGSLLRVVLQTLGSLKTPHRLGLQLFTGTGWTEVRTADVERWTARGEAGVHPRDRRLASLLVAGGQLQREVDSETLAALLAALASSDALVDRGGRSLEVSL